MVLDMYLNKEVYVGANHSHRNVKGVIYITEGNDNKLIKVNFDKISEIVERQAHWRKANSIHRWFVTNIQDGVDNCAKFDVSYEQLCKLRTICKELYAKKDAGNFKKLAAEILPSQEGFFFGPISYGDWYKDDLKHTIDQLSNLDKDASYTYQASW
jgi:hypothetical protein